MTLLFFRSGWLNIPEVHFELLGDRDGRRVATSPSTGLVLKMFSNEDEFSAERGIYERLNHSGIQYIPRYYGAFRNQWMQVDALLISHEGEPVGEEEIFTLTDWVSPS